MNLRFFYFGNQCPHNCYLLARIKTIAWHEHVPLHLYDLTEDATVAEKYRIFSPNLLIVNDMYRLHGPFTKDRVHSMLDDERVEPSRYVIRQSDEVVRGDLVAITSDSVLQTSTACVGIDDSGLCRGKSEWVTNIVAKTGLKHLGYIHRVSGKCVGGAEFLPSPIVPYPIPDKRDGNAFLTCSYMSDENSDFKTHPLEAMEKDLSDWGFDTLSVAASSEVVFPNGPAEWFEKKGFEDKGALVEEELHGAEIRYLQKRF
jgi:hypothetical protein